MGTQRGDLIGPDAFHVLAELVPASGIARTGQEGSIRLTVDPVKHCDVQKMERQTGAFRIRMVRLGAMRNAEVKKTIRPPRP